MTQFKNRDSSLRKFLTLFIVKNLFLLIIILNFSCATLLPKEERVYFEKIDYIKNPDTWKKSIIEWVSLRYGERGMVTKKEENDSILFDLGVAYYPDSNLKSTGSCHFELLTTYENNSLNLNFQDIFFINGYGKVVRDFHTHSSESGPNNPKDLQKIIDTCIKLAAQDLKDFIK